MNERRFIELLNLYVDQQISPEEASELEAAVLSDGQRRRTYEQYCRLQRACTILGEHERAHAPAHAVFNRALREAERKIAAPRRRPAWQSISFHPAFGASMAAACVAVVVIMVNRQPVNAPGGAVASTDTTTVVPAVSLAVSDPAAPATAPTSFEYQPAFAAAGLGVIRNAREAEIAATDKDALEWMQRVDGLPVASRLLVDESFDSPSTLHQDNRVFRSRRGLQSSAEFTAFQFQR